MSTKVCFRCNLEKDINEFYTHPQTLDGRLGKCKECTKTDVRQNYDARREQYSAYDQRRNRTPQRKADRMRHRKEDVKRSPEKNRARRAVLRAVKSGKLVRQPCIHCGATENVEGHHHDYSKPLDVRWVCFRCHREIEHGQKVTVPDKGRSFSAENPSTTDSTDGHGHAVDSV